MTLHAEILLYSGSDLINNAAVISDTVCLFKLKAKS